MCQFFRISSANLYAGDITHALLCPSLCASPFDSEMTSQQLPNDEPGVLKMAHQLSIWAKDGDPEKGIEHDTKFYTFSGQVPWAMPPCTEKITPDSAAEATDIPKPKVVLLRLLGPQDEQDHSFPHSCQRLLGFLKTEADIKTAFTAADALDLITNDHPQAVIVADPALTVRDTASPCYKPAASIVLEKLKTYVAAGGRAIFCCYVSRPTVDTKKTMEITCF